MRPFIKAVAAAALLLGGASAPNLTYAQTLKVGGTGAVTELLRQLASAFAAQSGIALEVIPSLGTGGGNAAVADGVIGLSVAGRDLKEKEVAKGLRIAATLRTPFGLVTSRPGPDNLDSEEIAELYRADKPAWPDGAPILIILRPVDESDNLVLASLFPGMAESIEHMRGRPDISIAATDQDNAEAAEKTEGSLVGATLTQVTTEKRDLRFVAIDGVAPSLENVADGSYPYEKTLYLVVPTELSPEAVAFLSFIETDAGEALLRDAGVLAGAP